MLSIHQILSENFSLNILNDILLMVIHPGGSTNTSRFGGRYETGDYESELREPFCLCLDPVITKSMTHTDFLFIMRRQIES